MTSPGAFREIGSPPLIEASPTNQDWVNQIVEEAVNQAMRPVHDQLAQLTALLQTAQLAAKLAPPTGSTPGDHTPHTEVSTLPPPNSSTARPKLLPDPPKFTGKRKEYAVWARQMCDKIENDAPIYNDNRRVWYMINSCLGPVPQAVVSTFYAEGGPGGHRDPSSFMDYLDRTNSDRNQKAQAHDNIYNLKQGDRELYASYLPRYE
jgi:hypothetical protein